VSEVRKFVPRARPGERDRSAWGGYIFRYLIQHASTIALGFINYRRGRARSFCSVQSALRMHTRRLLTVTFVREAARCGRNERASGTLGETGIIDPAEHTTARHNSHFSSYAKIFRVNGLGSQPLARCVELLNAYQGIHNLREIFKPHYVQCESNIYFFKELEINFFFLPNVEMWIFKIHMDNIIRPVW